jgi:Ni/Co efflux regulator RcnB
MKVTAVAAGLAFPHAAQAIQVVRRRRRRGTKKWSRETVYAITSLTATQASPAGLAAIIRGHWMIEDRLHWVRDMDFDEDRSQIRTASGRPRQHRRRAALSSPQTRPAATDDHELLNGFAGALGRMRVIVAIASFTRGFATPSSDLAAGILIEPR